MPSHEPVSPGAIAPEAVRAQLDRILTAAAFANAGRISRLLRYVVERTLAGEGDQLKEYVVGLEVFDRGDAYDPRLDSIVRVEARRLRAKLDEYHQGSGKADPIVITIPRGSYVATFAVRRDGQASAGEPGSLATPIELAGPVASVAPTAPMGANPPMPGTLRGSTLRSAAILGAFAGIITVVLVAAVASRHDDATSSAQTLTGPSIAVLLFQHYSASADDAIVAARLTDGVTTELARLGTVSVVSRASASQYTGEMRPAREIAKALNVDFIMESTLTIESSNLHVVARLVDGIIDRKVWVGEYDAVASEVRELARRIATDSAAAALTYRAAR